jgi:Tfp pilus assembly protein PilO
MEKILKRRVLIGGILGLILIVIIFIIFLYRPQFTQRSKIAKEVTSLKKQIKDNEQMVKEISRLKAQLIALEDSHRVFMSRILPRSAILPFVRRIVDEGQKYNLTFDEIKPPGLDTLITADNPKSPIKPVPFVLTFQGKFFDAMQFVDALSQESYFIRTPEIEIVSRDELTPAVEIKLLINFYVSSLVTP